MNEGEYLEMVNQLQEKFNLNELENNKIKEGYIELKKNFISLYGIIRILDMSEDIDHDAVIDAARTFASSIYDEFIL
jgi:hypothetical protein